MHSSLSMERTPGATSAIISGQKSEYSQSFGNAISTPRGPHIMEPRRSARRNDSSILAPFPHEDIEERPTKYQQSWPWKDRAHHSDIFESSQDMENRRVKTTKKWPWQDRASKSHVFEESKNSESDGLSQKQQWPWQSRAMSSEIFRDSAAPQQRIKPKEYSWHQAKSTHDHKVDGQAKLGVTQYMKDFAPADSGHLSKYLGPRHGYKYILKRRENTPDNGGGESDFVNQITKMSLSDAALYMKEAEKNMEKDPEKYD